MAGKSKRNTSAPVLSDNAGSRATKKKANRKGPGTGPPTSYVLAGTQPVPVFSGGPRGSTHFTNEEFIIDVVNGQPADTKILNLNPSTASTFPWLSRIAQGFELYRFKRLRISYTPSCATTASGVIVGAYEYDANDAVPITKQQLSSFEGSRRGSVFSKVVFDLVPNEGWYYTNPSGVQSGDARLTDMARFFYNVYGNLSPDGSILGELTASYTIEFAKPETTIVYASGVVSPVGSSISLLAGSSLTQEGDAVMQIASAGQGQFRLTATQSGKYLLTILGNVASASQIPTGNIIGGATLLRNGIVTLLGGLDFVAAYSAGATYPAMTQYAVTINVGDILTFTLAAAITTAQLLRVRYTFYKLVQA